MLTTFPSLRRIDVLNITEDDIDIEDIAHSLSRICRFGGHIPCHYSVAQHSILVAAGVPKAAALEGLMHDATEAYLGDIVSPLKKTTVFAGYRDLEERVAKVISSKFGLGMEYWKHEVHTADKRAYVTESLNFRGSVDDYDYHRWGVYGEGDTMLRLVPLSPKKAKAAFLSVFHELKDSR